MDFLRAQRQYFKHFEKDDTRQCDLRNCRALLSNLNDSDEFFIPHWRRKMKTTSEENTF